jgi:NodT family efflux transporter outer membrane factor (OMF) lipoprotein
MGNMRSFKNLLLMMPMLSVTLAGCDLGPGPQQPNLTMPAAWSGPAAAQAAPNADIWPAPDWWRSFQSPELDALIAQAQAGNLDIAAAAARVVQADAQLRVSQASLWPSITLNGDLRQRGPVDDGTLIESSRTSSSRSLSSDLGGSSSSGGGSGGGGGGGSTSSRTSLELSVGAQYELDFWGKNRDNVDAARAQLQANQYDRETVALTVTTGVATTYLEIMALRDRIALAQQTLASAQEVERVVEAKAANGAVSGLDLAQQRSQVAAQQASIPPLQLQEKQALNALALLLGRNPEGFQVAGKGLGGIALPTVAAGLPSGLLTRRPDIKEAEANLTAANANLNAARAAMLPTIDLSGTLSLEALAASLTFGGLGAAYSAAASLAQPIFDAGQLRAQKDVTAGRQVELIQSYKSAILGGLSDVENALASIDSLRNQRQFLDAQRDQARTALAISQAQYKAGSTELLTVLDAQRTLFQAQDQEAQTILAQFQAAVTLYKALGGGWQAGAVTTTAQK